MLAGPIDVAGGRGGFAHLLVVIVDVGHSQKLDWLALEEHLQRWSADMAPHGWAVQDESVPCWRRAGGRQRVGPELEGEEALLAKGKAKAL